MAKDPAFLFYPNDFDAKTKFFTDEQVGIYLRLLIAQFQHGHLSERQVNHICKTHDTDVLSKFDRDADGNYYNERLEFEIERRKKYTESRKLNRNRKNKSSHMKNISDSYVQHMENENENENSNVVIPNNKISKKELKIIEQTIFDDFLNANCPSVRKLKIQMTPEQAEKLATEFGMQACHEIFEAMENWQPLTKKSKSVFLTAKTWLNKRKQTATTNGKQKLTFTEAAMDWLNRTS